MDTAVTGNKVPLYHQVSRTLRQRVRTGVYLPGRSLPSVRTLSEEFGVSVTVVQRAMRHLEEKGVVVAHHGKGITLVGEKACRQTAILFGFLHPYAGSMAFHRDVLAYVDEAFAGRANFAVVRSSKDDPAAERQIAEHLVANGARGLILWPTNDDPNGEYFAKLSKKIPVVLVDRLLGGADLPAVVHDCLDCGREICRHIFGRQKKRRLLVLVDNLRISPYEEIVRGLEAAAGEMGRVADITTVQLPITELLQQFNFADFSRVDACAQRVERLLKEGLYDAVFCTQDEFIDYVMVETGMMERFSQVQLATTKAFGINTRSRRYNSLAPLEWRYNSGEMVSRAADLVQRWVLSRRMPRGVVRLEAALTRTN